MEIFFPIHPQKKKTFCSLLKRKAFISHSLCILTLFCCIRGIVLFCDKSERREDMTRTTRCCLRNLSRLAFAMENAASTSAASSSSSLSETRRLFHHQRTRTTRKGTVVPSSSIATASRVAEHKQKDHGKEEEDDVKTIAVTFTEKTGEEITVRAKVGESLMEAAHENDVELEGRI